MTCSIGFRAPAHADLLGNFVDDYLIRQDSSPFYQDAGRPLPDHPARLDSRSLQELRAILRLQTLSDEQLNRWLGAYLTEPKQADAVLSLEPPLDRATVKDIIARLPVLVRNPWARLAYTLEAGQLTLFAAGHALPLAMEQLEAVQWLSDHSIYDLRQVPAGADNPAVFDLLQRLINLGVLLIDEPD
jgi:50S ribosomal protein L16 3-hydroxylase